MELNPNKFDVVFEKFHTSWPMERIRTMTLEEYADLGDQDSFCYWLEYGSPVLGEIGNVRLNKFEIWKPKTEKVFKDGRFEYDPVTGFAWNIMQGLTLEKAFDKIQNAILKIAQAAAELDWAAVDKVHFHSIAKWKIAFLYSNKLMLPIYAKPRLMLIAKGLGKEFSDSTTIPELQQYILRHKKEEYIADFAYRVYMEYADKASRNYYLIGSKYGQPANQAVIDKFIMHKCVAMGFIDWLDFSQFMGADKKSIAEFAYEHSENDNKQPEADYFYRLSQIKEGDMIAVKSRGGYGETVIIAYAEVVKRDGKIYEHREGVLGHHINVEFLDWGFQKITGYSYRGTLYSITAKERINTIFGAYCENPEESDVLSETSDDEGIDDSFDRYIYHEYSPKIEGYTERSAIAATRVKLAHNNMQNKFIRYMSENWEGKIGGEKMRIDAWRETAHEIIIYEIKPYHSPYTCMRSGIGQLLDYCHNMKTKKKKRIAIVGLTEPEQNDLDYLFFLRQNIKVDFSYISFDPTSSKVKEF